ncbi:hypothetical protein D3C81_762350 [compost metagenome]
MLTQVLLNPFREFTERLHFRPDRASKVADIILVIRSSVNDNDIITLKCIMPFFGRKSLPADLVRIKLSVVNPEGDELLPITYKQLFEGVTFGLINLEDNVFKQRISPQISHILLGLFHGAGQSTIDAFFCNKDTAFDA